MSLFSQLMVLVVSLAGIIFGMSLSYISPEEMVPGKKYFLLLKRLITVLIFILAVYISLVEKKYYFILVPIAVLLLFLIIIRPTSSLHPKKVKTWHHEIVSYFMFTGVYVFTLETNLKMLMAVLIFIYGLPAGTMILEKKNET